MKTSSAIFVIFLVTGCAVSDSISDNDDSEIISHLSSVLTESPLLPSSSSATINQNEILSNNSAQNATSDNSSLSNFSSIDSNATRDLSSISKTNVSMLLRTETKNPTASTSEVSDDHSPSPVNDVSKNKTENVPPAPVDEPLPPNISTEDSDTVERTTEGFSVPKELPHNASVCPNAEACIKNLTEHKNRAENNSNIDTEVTDLRDGTDAVLREEAEIDGELNQPKNQMQVNSSEVIDTEAVLIEDGDNTEEKIRLAVTKEALEEVERGPGVPLIQGQLAAILAAVFVAVSVFAYVALLWWRRYLEHRYGSRQMLVNEDDFDDINDLRHFSI